MLLLVERERETERQLGEYRDVGACSKIKLKNGFTGRFIIITCDNIRGMCAGFVRSLALYKMYRIRSVYCDRGGQVKRLFSA